MDNYINLLRFILKNFDINHNKEFDELIKYIINKIFDEYYHNRNNSKYCIDNLIRKYDIKYFCLQRKYGIIKNKKLFLDLINIQKEII